MGEGISQLLFSIEDSRTNPDIFAMYKTKNENKIQRFKHLMFTGMELETLLFCSSIPILKKLVIWVTSDYSVYNLNIGDNDKKISYYKFPLHDIIAIIIGNCVEEWKHLDGNRLIHILTGADHFIFYFHTQRSVLLFRDHFDTWLCADFSAPLIMDLI